MLATFGFTIAGIFFLLFGLTFREQVIKRTKLGLSGFVHAYYSLAVALWVWAVASANGSDEWLKRSVIIGDLFLLVGTLFMLSLWLSKKTKHWLWLATMVALLLVYIRVKYYYPAPFLRDSLLIFNTQQPVAVVLGLIFTLVWLPTNIKVARLVTDKIKQPTLRSTYSMIYALATASALIFIAAKKTSTVALSFASITVCFAMLIASNWLVAKVGSPH